MDGHMDVYIDTYNRDWARDMIQWDRLIDRQIAKETKIDTKHIDRWRDI